MTIPQTTPAAAALATMPQAKPRNVEDAAKQFESLLIAQMLRTAREAASDDEDDSTGSTMMEVSEQHFSQLLANNGGLGLAKLVVKGLNNANQ